LKREQAGVLLGIKSTLDRSECGRSNCRNPVMILQISPFPFAHLIENWNDRRPFFR